MFLKQDEFNTVLGRLERRSTAEDRPTAAGTLFPKIEEFVELSHLLSLTQDEEETLVSMSSKTWQVWRTLAISETSLAPALLVRRLDYAVALLNRMAAAAYDGTRWTGRHPIRL